MAEINWVLSFKRWLLAELQSEYDLLQDMLGRLVLSTKQDVPKWRFAKSSIFTMKSMSIHLHADYPNQLFKQLWKVKIPLKIKIWL